MRRHRFNFICALLLILVCSTATLSGSKISEEFVKNLADDEVLVVAEYVFGMRNADSLLLRSGAYLTLSDQLECGNVILKALTERVYAESSSVSLRSQFEGILEQRATTSRDQLDESYQTEHFTIHYTIDAGDNQVDGWDQDNGGSILLPDGSSQDLVDGTGPGNYGDGNAPDYIERIGIYLEYSMDKFNLYGFNGGSVPDWLQDIYVQNLSALGIAYWPWYPFIGGRIELDNDMGDFSLSVTCSHELFHHYQFSYDGHILLDTGEDDWISEGTAKWSEDIIFDDNNGYMFYFDGSGDDFAQFMNEPDEKLTDMSYDAVLFWKYFTEQYSDLDTEPQVGVDVMEAFWDECVGHDGIDAATQILQDQQWGHGISFETSFSRWIVANYAKDLGNPYAGYYDYVEDEQGYTYASVSTRFGRESLTKFETIRHTGESVSDWGSDYFVILPADDIETIKIEIDGRASLFSPFGSPYYQVITIKNQSILSIYSHASLDWNLSFDNSDFDEILVIVAGLNDGGDYDIAINGGTKWTILAFINGDNNLESMALDDINEMEQIGSSYNVNIVVQVDRAAGFDNSNGDWTDTRRYFVTQDDNQNTIGSTRLDTSPALGELDMGDPLTLSDFVTWGVDQFPAERYAIVVWDHGSGWYKELDDPEMVVKGVSYDDQSGNNIGVANGELEGALSAIQQTLGKRIELLGFDACLMQMWEVESIASSYADVMVTSEQTEAGQGWAYDNFLDDLIATPTMTASTLGTNIVDAAIDDGLATQSAIDLTKIASLTSAVDLFGKKLHWGAKHNYQSVIIGLRDATQEFATPSHIDLWDFANRVSNSASLPSCLRDAATAVRTKVTEAVIHSDHSSGFAGAHGIAIYYPEAGYDANYDNLAVASETHWDEFIQNVDYTADLAVELGIERLIAAQQFQAPDRGYWTFNGSASVGVTALAVRALVKAGYTYSDQPVRRGMNFIIANNHGANQAFYNLSGTSQTYETSLALMAMEDVQNQAGGSLDTYITWARNYLINGRNPQDGGWRYYSRYYPSDLSVSQWPALALYEGNYSDQTLWDGVRDFAISRQKANGEFTYGAGYGQGGGAITGAGLWCLLFHRDIDFSNPRVQNGFNWFISNWSVTSCPGWSHGGAYGYYYYYIYSLAKACDLSGQTMIGSHDWFREISTQLLSLQGCDGSWPRYQGASEYGDLPTVFALLTLQTKAIPANSRLVVSLHSNADLHLYGPGGTHTGLDYSLNSPTMQTGIPNSIFEYVGSDSAQVIAVDPIEEGGAYGYRLHGTGNGPWELLVEAYQDGYLIAADTIAGQINVGTDLGCEVIVTASGGNLLVFPCEPDTLPCVATNPVILAHGGAPADTINGHFYIKESCGSKSIAGINLIAHSLQESSSSFIIPQSAMTLSPAHIDSIPAGDSVAVNYRIIVPASAPNGSYVGTIGIETFNALNRGINVELRIGLGGITVRVEHNGNPIIGVPVDISNTQGLVLYSGYTGYDGSSRDSVSAGFYVVTITPPLGYFNTNWEYEQLIQVRAGVEDTVVFELSQMQITSPQWPSAYWRHMANQVADGVMTTEIQQLRRALPRYADLIWSHFQNNPIHPIPIFGPSYPAGDEEKIALIVDLLRLNDFSFAEDLAKPIPDVYDGSVYGTLSCKNRGLRELTTALLNIVSMKRATFDYATLDSLTVGQVVTFTSDVLLNGDNTDDCQAYMMLYYTNLGVPIGSGVLPADVVDVLYMQGVEQTTILPTEYALDQNYPNPFNLGTKIVYRIPVNCNVTISVFNVTGQLVKELIDQPHQAGIYSVNWNGRDNSNKIVASGIYFYRINAGEFSNTKKMILLK